MRIKEFWNVPIKIDEVRVYWKRIPYYSPFVIATATITYADITILIVKARNYVGIGEQYRLSREKVNEYVTEVKKLVGLAPKEVLSRTWKYPLSIEMAVLDLIAKANEIKFGELFSPMKSDRIFTDITIGISGVETTIKELEEAFKRGFKSFKIKVGKDLKLDKERIRKICERLPTNASLRIDANQGYTFEEASEFIKFIEKCIDEFGVKIDFLEQPLPKDELEKIGKLRDITSIPIIVDESVRVSKDVDKVKEYVDGVNLKIVKANSIIEFARAAEKAREYGLKLMVGCSGETNVGISCDAHIAIAYEFDFADLDSDLFKPDVVKKKVTLCENSYRVVKGPGIGITEDDLKLDELERIL